MALTEGPGGAHLVLANVEYSNAEPETYVIPLALGANGASPAEEHPELTVANLRLTGARSVVEGRLFEASADPRFAGALLEMVERRRRVRGQRGELIATAVPAWRGLRGDRESPCEPRALKAEQSNSSMVYGDRLILKLFRMLDPGVNPDLEIGRMLDAHAHFAHTPPLAGWLEYQTGRDEPRTVGVLHGFIPNQGDAWTHAQARAQPVFRARVDPQGPHGRAAGQAVGRPGRGGSAGADGHGGYRSVSGDRRAAGAAHRRAACRAGGGHRRSRLRPRTLLGAFISARSTSRCAIWRARFFACCVRGCPFCRRPKERKRVRCSRARRLVTARFQEYLRRRFTVTRIRTHGDLHLGQVLHAGKDFAIIDFEGEPARPLSERRRKRSALRDVSGMLRSFHYAAMGSMLEHLRHGTLSPSMLDALGPWARLWQVWASWAYLKEYLKAAGGADFIPRDREELRILLDAFLLDKAIYELSYELNNRPDWVAIPLQGISQVLRRSGLAEAGLEEAYFNGV